MRYLDRVRRLALILALLSCRTSAPAPAPVAPDASAPVAPDASAPARRPPADARAALIELLPAPRNEAPYGSEAPGWRDERQLWWGLVEQLRRLPDGPERDELLRRGLAAAATWPDELRAADTGWIELLRSGAATPFGWSLFRTAMIDDIDTAERLLARGAFAEMTSLSLYLRGNDICDRWPAFAATLAAAPGLERLEKLTIRLPTCAGPEHIAHLGGLTSLPRLRRLALPQWIGPRNAVALAASPLLARLVELDLSQSPVRAEGLAALGKSPHLQQLEVLRLAHGLVAPDAPGFKDTPSWAGLRTLDLADNRLSDAALAALADNRALAGLRVLDLTRVHGVTDAALAKFVAGLPALEVVRLDRTNVGDLALAELVRTAGPNLREIVLPYGQVGPDGLAVLAGRELPRLERLDLTDNRVGPAGGAALASARMPALRHLRLNGCELGSEAVRALVRGLTTTTLETLELSGDLRGDPDGVARAIAARTDWKGLHTLNLAGNAIGPDGFTALAAAPHLASLRKLDLYGNRPREAGWRALVGSPHLAHLVAPYWRRQLALHDTTLSPADEARAIPPDFALRIERRESFGTAPIYHLTVDAAGRVTYLGTQHVTTVGTATGQVDLRTVRLLLASIDGFLATRPAAHPSRGGTCGVHVFDGPSVAAEIRRDGGAERYVSDEICALGVSQQALFDLAERVDILTGSARWTGAPHL